MTKHDHKHDHGHRDLTRNQSLVLGALEKAEGPLSAYTILDRLRGDGLRAPLQVYRALDKLLAAGLVHRLETLNAFVACGQVDEFSDEGVRERLGAWSQARGFKTEKTTIEIRGHCATCLAAA
jgi:Fur family zinc uptake transcriptional regulator